MYIDFNALEYEKIINEKEQEIKTSKEKIKIYYNKYLIKIIVLKI